MAKRPPGAADKVDRLAGWKARECAAALGMSERNFRLLVKSGAFPEKPEGGYRIADIVKAYVKYIEQGRTTETLATKKQRELELDIMEKEDRMRERRGALLDREEARSVIGGIIAALANGLDAAPTRMTDRIVAATGGDRARVLDMLTREHRQLRQDLADALLALHRDRRAAAAA